MLIKVVATQGDTTKALLSLWGAYLILDTPEGGLSERGLIIERDLLKKLDEKDIYDSFILYEPFTSYFADSPLNSTSQIHTYDRFLSQTTSRCKDF